MPVSEIARLAGVSHRTLSKYIKGGGWRRRYRKPARGAEDEGVHPAIPHRAATHRHDASAAWRRPSGPGRKASTAAQARGAGGRFIPRADIGKPFATGLKALDPAGRASALAACGKARRLSRVAQARAKKEAQFARFERALADNVRFAGELRRHQDNCARGHPSALQLRIAGLMLNSVEWSLGRVEVLIPAAAAMFTGRSLPPARTGAAPPSAAPSAATPPPAAWQAPH